MWCPTCHGIGRAFIANCGINLCPTCGVTKGEKRMNYGIDISPCKNCNAGPICKYRDDFNKAVSKIDGIVSELDLPIINCIECKHKHKLNGGTIR